jgi:hypothetical protein
MEPKFIKSVFGRRVLYQAVFRRNLLVIRFGSRDRKEAKYRIFFNRNVIIRRDENGKSFQQFHSSVKSAKAELARFGKFAEAPGYKTGSYAVNKWTTPIAKEIYQ